MAAEVAAMPLQQQLGAIATLCEGAVSSAFFQQVVAVIPLLLLTLGVEFSFFQRTLVEPVQRAAAAATATVMSIGLALALSTMPWAGTGCGEVLGLLARIPDLRDHGAGRRHGAGDARAGFSW